MAFLHVLKQQLPFHDQMQKILSWWVKPHTAEVLWESETLPSEIPSTIMLSERQSVNSAPLSEEYYQTS